MLTIACVKHGKKYGPEYVNILRDMVERNLPEMTGRFVCFTDDPAGINCDTQPLPEGVSGWWAKLYLFEACRGPTVYFDLDTVITGPLDEIMNIRPGFTILREFGRSGDEYYGSGLMAWDGDYSNIWHKWLAAEKPMTARGDQEWIERCLPEVNFWQDLFPGKVLSFKADRLWSAPPSDAWVVCFHGEPRPHNVGGWVKKVWCVGGGTSGSFKLLPNVDECQLIDNMLANKGRELVEMQPAHDRVAAIVAGGPSLKQSLPLLSVLDADVFACNGTGNFLHQKGIPVRHQVIIDARPGNARFRVEGVSHLLASQVHPPLFEGVDARMFHCFMQGIDTLVGQQITIGGGSTVGLKACVLAYVLGYRNIHLFGFDSCYESDNGHAYEQPENADEEVFSCEWGGKTYRAAAWMIRQAEEFPYVAEQLVENGCEIAVHGNGWIPDMAQAMAGDSAEYEAWMASQAA